MHSYHIIKMLVYYYIFMLSDATEGLQVHKIHINMDVELLKRKPLHYLFSVEPGLTEHLGAAKHSYRVMSLQNCSAGGKCLVCFAKTGLSFFYFHFRNIPSL